MLKRALLQTAALPQPSLNLNFLTMGGTLDPRIAFTQATLGTYYNSAGTLTYNRGNLIKNSTMVGAAAGSPGTSPTGWVFTGSSVGLTYSIAATGFENGFNYIDWNVAGTCNSSAAQQFPFIGSPIIAAFPGVPMTQSCYLKLVSGSLAALTNFQLDFNYLNASGTYIAEQGGDIKGSITSTMTRFSVTGSLADNTLAFVQPFIKFQPINTNVYNFTVRIYAPQMEYGSTASPFIPTTNANIFAGRFDYNPSTLALNGFLVEQASTNLALQSAALATTPWNVAGGAALPTSGATAPDGTTNGFTYTNASSGAFQGGTQLISGLTAGTVYSFSIFVKGGTARYIGVQASNSGNAVSYVIDTQTGNFIARSGFPATTVSTQSVGNGWYRFQFTYTQWTATTTSQVFVLPGVASALDGSWTANSLGTDLAWGAQFEALSFATSYIPTTTTTVTRNADAATMATSAFGFNNNSGTVFYAAIPGTLTQNGVFLQLDDGTDANRYFHYRSTSGNQYFWNNIKTTQVLLGASASLSVHKAIGVYGGGIAGTLDGGTIGSDSATTLSTGITTLRIGAVNVSGTSYINGWLQQVKYWPQRLPNNTLINLTH